MARVGSTLEQTELHVWPRRGDGPALDLAVSRSAPKGRAEPVVDLGLLATQDGEASARALRLTGRVAGVLQGVQATERSLNASFGDPSEAKIQLSIAPAYRRAGLLYGTASGEIEALGRSFSFDDAHLLLIERHGARRPYAWVRATLRGEVEGEPVLCIIETARRRAGSVVLPELGRLRLLGPGTRHLPRTTHITPLPLRAEYGTGSLRATALAPGLRLGLELTAPPAATAVFEVVDPSGEAAYAHRALGATATLSITSRRRDAVTLVLDGRYEWGARAGDPRVALRAWRA